MGRYKEKIQRVMYIEEFNKLLETKKILKDSHRALLILLYYTGIRISEALNIKRKQFKRVGGKLYVDIGQRLKGSKVTPPLIIPLSKANISFLVNYYLNFKPDQKLFSFSRKTAYNVVSRVFGYPHYFRLNRITLLLLNKNITIPHIKTYTGLNAKTIDHYVGLASMSDIGEAL